MEKDKVMFLQYIVNEQCIEKQQAVEKFQAIRRFLSAQNPDTELEEIDIKIVLNSINRSLLDLDLTLVNTKCEVNGAEYITLITTTLNAIFKQQKKFSHSETTYFNALLHEILISTRKCFPMIEALNLSTGLEKPLTLESAEKFILDAKNMGYIFELDGSIYLGPRCTAEYANYIRSNYGEYAQICDLCSELVCYGKFCNKCNKVRHKHCLDAFRDTDVCPICKGEFDNEILLASQSVLSQSQLQSQDLFPTQEPRQSQRASKRKHK